MPIKQSVVHPSAAIEAGDIEAPIELIRDRVVDG
jgi:hypothetical protein